MTNDYGFAPKSILVVLGTRPEIVKLAGVIRLLGDAARVVHTGQHYDPNLSDSFFRELSLPEPDFFLGIGGATRGRQIGEALRLLDQHLATSPAAALLTQGDTNATVAGSLAANARETFLGHVEAGLRSRDRRMPEEHNRVIADHLSDLCLAPTPVAVDNLGAEGIPGERIVLTGNTVVEAVQQLLPAPGERQEIAAAHGLAPGRYVVATFHRPENVDDGERFRIIVDELAALPLPVILPLHPRSVERAARFGLGPAMEKLVVTEPLGYREFLALEAEAAVIVSDSGGIAEEASVVKRPLVVVRNSTERPEVMGTFATRVTPGPAIGIEVGRCLEEGWDHLQALPSPYGDGSASRLTVEALANRLG
jgi:UDP-N-acetylglucosamine 2-epimerase (non-hydrolysing)